MATNKQLIKQISKYKALYIDPKTGIAWIEDGSTGTGTSAHPNISANGSVAQMKKRGFWGNNDCTVKSHGFIFNIDLLAGRDKDSEIARKACLCGGVH